MVARGLAEAGGSHPALRPLPLPLLISLWSLAGCWRRLGRQSSRALDTVLQEPPPLWVRALPWKARAPGRGDGETHEYTNAQEQRQGTGVGAATCAVTSGLCSRQPS